MALNCVSTVGNRATVTKGRDYCIVLPFLCFSMDRRCGETKAGIWYCYVPGGKGNAMNNMNTSTFLLISLGL